MQGIVLRGHECGLRLASRETSGALWSFLGAKAHNFQQSRADGTRLLYERDARRVVALLGLQIVHEFRSW